MKNVAIIQSNYIPWKGYFDIIHDADLFIFYDDVQYTKNDWRNRNQIKTPNGLSWLTIPTGTHLDLRICDVKLPNSKWAIKHWKSICQNYSKAPYFNRYRDFFEELFLHHNFTLLSDFNQHMIQAIAKDILKIDTEFQDSRRYQLAGKRFDRLLNLLTEAEADHYISGPAAKSYIDEKSFWDAGIQCTFKDYSGFPEYPQFKPPFEHFVSILDLIFHTGPDAPFYIWGWRQDKDKTTQTEL